MARRPQALKPFNPDKEKILEVILYIINKWKGLSQYDILKTIFLADRAHMNKYGRPITFDNYVAMEHGPVPSLTYDLLKPETRFDEYFDEERPWNTIPDGNINQFVKAKREFNKNVLSKSDIHTLDSALDIITSLSFAQIKRLTHGDPAYIEAWKRRGPLPASDMDMTLLLDDADQETIERLAYSSHPTLDDV
jgi:uncharacterized phage-associated protein